MILFSNPLELEGVRKEIGLNDVTLANFCCKG